MHVSLAVHADRWEVPSRFCFRREFSLVWRVKEGPLSRLTRYSSNLAAELLLCCVM